MVKNKKKDEWDDKPPLHIVVTFSSAIIQSKILNHIALTKNRKLDMSTSFQFSDPLNYPLAFFF